VYDCVQISATDGDVLFSLTAQTCAGTSHDFPTIRNVQVYSPLANATICEKTVATMAAAGNLTNVSTLPLARLTAASIVQSARHILAMP
jgi:hypothetical protein